MDRITLGVLLSIIMLVLYTQYDPCDGMVYDIGGGLRGSLEIIECLGQFWQSSNPAVPRGHLAPQASSSGSACL